MQVSQEDRIAPQEKRSGASAITIAVVIILLIAAAGAYFLLGNKDTAPEPELPTPVTLPEITPAEPLPADDSLPEPEILPEPETDPVVEIAPTPQVEPLPTLAESDQYAHDKTLEVANGMKIDPLLVEEDLIRHFVVFVDNLAQGELARKVSPLKAPNRNFTVSDVTDKTYLNPDSYHRYDLYADFVTNLDEAQLATTYKQVSPLLSEAFEELGYGDKPFDERMIEAIDIMLAAPIIEQAIELDSVSVNYQFVDPELEALPNAQKLMIRMGPENSKKIKAALRKLKKQLTQ
ncbi:DUF3014 domain-containing protein [Shewanella colwelliana]|uniref:DUF3014 domain-containing protein n=1 Tax=Shewanella colwelliana TaxID=23 RepID=UPI0022B015BB|nr:DUF3014 domain-containing protein [Shewanella colwelliana]MCZ4337912.1 DUF3014 domain-containing protein [Shewanella colwelliana]